MKNYLDFNTYLKNKFNCKVYKVVIDAGFSCPNRDNTISSGGCIYCNAQGSGLGNSHLPIKEQTLNGIKFIKNWYKKAEKIMVYFQAFSNTHANPESLKKIYSQALCHDDIIGIAIGTRPDCICEEKLEIINSFTDKYEVWIEYGIQSAHNKTLKAINRGHTFEQFKNAVNITKKYKNIKICTHVIFGLPGETKQDMLKTIEKIKKLNLDGIKFHALYIEKNTPLEKIYNKKPFALLTQEEYIDLVCRAIKILPENIIIQRLTSECKKDMLIAPDWILNKAKIGHLINTNLG